MDQGKLENFSSLRTDFTPEEKSLINSSAGGYKYVMPNKQSESVRSVTLNKESAGAINSVATSKQIENRNSLAKQEAGSTLNAFRSEPFVKEDSKSLVRPPSYEVISTGADINITYSQLEENIGTLREAINTLKSSWDGETKNNISIINGSWAGTDCSEYTKKLSNMDTKVQNTIAALELLCSTYEKARDMVKENQTKAVSSIVSLS